MKRLLEYVHIGCMYQLYSIVYMLLWFCRLAEVDHGAWTSPKGPAVKYCLDNMGQPRSVYDVQTTRPPDSLVRTGPFFDASLPLFVMFFSFFPIMLYFNTVE